MLLSVCSNSSFGLKSENIRGDSLVPQKSTDRQFIKDIVIENQWESYSTHWFYCDNNKETKGVKCQIKELSKPWKTFNSFGEAGNYYDWLDLSNMSTRYFPVDGSIYTGRRRRGRGWQFRRILEGTT